MELKRDNGAEREHKLLNILVSSNGFQTVVFNLVPEGLPSCISLYLQTKSSTPLLVDQELFNAVVAIGWSGGPNCGWS